LPPPFRAPMDVFNFKVQKIKKHLVFRV